MSIRTGRVVPVRNDGSFTMGLDGPLLGEDESDTWSLTIQPVNGIAPLSATNAFIKYWVGEASFSLPALPVTQALQRVLVTGRRVTLDFQGAVGGAPGITPVSVGLARGGQLLGPESGGQWVATGAANASNYTFNAGAQRIYAAQANVVAFLQNPTLYVLLIDQTAPLASGVSVPVAGGRSNALTAGNPSADFAGQFTPLVIQQQLRVALSTTPDVYTAPVGNPTFTFDYFQGLQ